MDRRQKSAVASPIALELRRCLGAFVAVGVFSAAVNILYLSGSLFMMEVYDRVLPSRSVPTLIGLLVIVMTLYAFQGVFDLVRSRLLLRIADRVDLALTPAVYDTIVRLQLRAPGVSAASNPSRDLDTVRAFLSGAGPAAFFDLPWLPFYLAICFAFHFWIGVTATAGALVLTALALLGEVASRRPMHDVSTHALARARLAETGRRHAEVATVLGIAPRLKTRWSDASRAHMEANSRAAARVAGLGAVSKTLRLALQSGILAVGAYLVINNMASGGVIIASSILSARALAPVDQAIAHWKGFVAARQAKTRLDRLLADLADHGPARMDLPPPRQMLSVVNASVTAPESHTVLLADIALALRAGSGLGVVGPSGSGKSTFARMLAGVWPPTRGTVRLDGAALDQWPSAALARHIGYMPQGTSLLDGTIAENIAAFDPDAAAADIIAAAKAARVHDLIVSLPQGYGTRLDDHAPLLSAGQQQRVALARALYGDPFLVILDEPNSNLDAEGEEALTEAILAIRARGGIAVVVAHRPSALAGVDHVLMLAGGKMQAFGPKDEVLAQVLKGGAQPTPARRPTAARGGTELARIEGGAR